MKEFRQEGSTMTLEESYYIDRMLDDYKLSRQSIRNLVSKLASIATASEDTVPMILNRKSQNAGYGRSTDVFEELLSDETLLCRKINRLTQSLDEVLV